MTDLAERPSIEDAVACIRNGDSGEISRIFEEIGQLGLIDVMADAIARIYPLLPDQCAHAVEHTLLGTIGTAYALKMMGLLFKSTIGRIRLFHIKAAIKAEQLELLQRFVEHRKLRGFPTFELAGTPACVNAMKTGNIKLLQLLDENVGILTMREFGKQVLPAAFRYELWDAVAWLLEVKRIGLQGVVVPEAYREAFQQRGWLSK